jgi:TRAP-type C4-dicarboxylate transport system permease small subunit
LNDSRGLLRLFVRLNAPFAWVSAALTLLMMLTVVYDVIARVVFRAPTLWVIDVNEYMLVYLTFIPAAWILLRDNHVKVELAVERLPLRARRITDFVGDLLGLLYCGILAWQSWLVSWTAYQGSFRFSTALALPQFPVFVIIPIGAAWLGLAFLVRLWTTAREGFQGPPPSEKA